MPQNQLIFHPEYLAGILEHAHHLSPVPIYQLPQVDSSPPSPEELAPFLIQFETERRLTINVLKGRLVALDICSTDEGNPYIIENSFWYGHTVDQTREFHAAVKRAMMASIRC